jgi:hypothetical protein
MRAWAGLARAWLPRLGACLRLEVCLHLAVAQPAPPEAVVRGSPVKAAGLRAGGADRAALRQAKD